MGQYLIRTAFGAGSPTYLGTRRGSSRCWVGSPAFGGIAQVFNTCEPVRLKMPFISNGCGKY